MVSSVDLAHYGVSRAKDWLCVDCGTNILNVMLLNKMIKSLDWL